MTELILQTDSGYLLVVDANDARESLTLRHTLEDSAYSGEVFVIPSSTDDALREAFRYIRHHRGHNCSPVNPGDPYCPFDQAFIERSTQQVLELLEVADFLNIVPLLDLIGFKLASIAVSVPMTDFVKFFNLASHDDPEQMYIRVETGGFKLLHD
ncbi:hypothetical protein CC1G_04940 [Coprinopsis cinerea okayama7|uniref:SKP1 component POZ domain-containing protein n=1 Tax=Coprinopsis cinerea (strain Okayama-7 / 130 / ATCC MYA-4618 / FGSC 9003) TaxID=240176 RepID=A8PFM3_COPC7|nr:hypothetical protein CC1G_04940 [Coprinopsis cinerea okayama7\|eukprot:XP_001841096.1 hypothetical protein CC1G_04940 [Coprinopsis cinerea okayama7\